MFDIDKDTDINKKTFCIVLMFDSFVFAVFSGLAGAGGGGGG
jgi:hypothetical protein